MNFRRTIFGIAIILIAFLSMSVVFAADLDCNLPENRETCLAELAKTENEISDLNKQLSGLKNEGASIARDKAILENQAKQAKLKIKTHELSIAKLG